MFFTLLFDGFIFKHPLSVTIAPFLSPSGGSDSEPRPEGPKKTYCLIRMDSRVKPENEYKKKTRMTRAAGARHIKTSPENDKIKKFTKIISS